MVQQHMNLLTRKSSPIATIQPSFESQLEFRNSCSESTTCIGSRYFLKTTDIFPVGIDSVRKGFQKPRTKPDNVLRWVNGADPEDFVVLRSELTSDNFVPGIENHPDIHNSHEDRHAISGYLSNARIAKALAESIA